MDEPYDHRGLGGGQSKETPVLWRGGLPFSTDERFANHANRIKDFQPLYCTVLSWSDREAESIPEAEEGRLLAIGDWAKVQDSPVVIATHVDS